MVTVVTDPEQIPPATEHCPYCGPFDPDAKTCPHAPEPIAGFYWCALAERQHQNQLAAIQLGREASRRGDSEHVLRHTILTTAPYADMWALSDLIGCAEAGYRDGLFAEDDS